MLAYLAAQWWAGPVCGVIKERRAQPTTSRCSDNRVRARSTSACSSVQTALPPRNVMRLIRALRDQVRRRAAWLLQDVDDTIVFRKPLVVRLDEMRAAT